jgi:hypothetical protein
MALADRGFSNDQVEQILLAGLNAYKRNDPIDLVKIERPWLKNLLAKSKDFSGAAEYIVTQLRVSYGSNGRFIGAKETLEFTERNTLGKAEYPWATYHEGMEITSEELQRNGMSVNDTGTGFTATKADADVCITDLLKEKYMALKEGAHEKMSQLLHANGASSPLALQGLDAIVSLTPAVGTLGGINRATKSYWRNHVALGLVATDGTIASSMEDIYRKCMRKGKKPNAIYMGYDFYKALRDEVKTQNQTSINFNTGSAGVDFDAGVSMGSFKGIPIEVMYEWDDDFGGALVSSTPWAKRCYMINDTTICLRPLKGEKFNILKPRRPHDKFVWYVSMVWKGALECSDPSSNGVLSIA